MSIALTAADLKVSIVMIRRAQCTGEEALNVAATLQKLEKLFQITAQAEASGPVETEEENEYDDERASQ